MQEIIEYQKKYRQFKVGLDTEFRNAAESFVRIGYKLKEARDTDILKGSQYKNVIEFAQAEYGLDKTQVSKFIRINDRFSEGGYSEQLQEQYRGYGHAKLTIMLQLPDEINEELTPGFSKSEIQEIKNEYDEEQKISDLEVLMEGQDERTNVLDDNLHKAIWQLGKDAPDTYVKLHEAVKSGESAVYETMAPDGEKIYSVRIQGVGKMMLSIKEMDKSVKLINVRSDEKEEYSWQEVFNSIEALMSLGLDAEASWSKTYGEEFPKKAEVAPVQPPQKKEAPRKESKVQKVKEKPKAPIKEPEKESEEQLPGQDSILNHPEYLPEEMKETIEPQTGSSSSEETQPENVTENSEIVDTTPMEEKQAQAVQEMENTLEEEKAAVVVETPERKSQEELISIWNNAAIAVAKLNIFFQNSSAMELAKDEIPTETLNRAYKSAISVAADLERILNHGKI